MSAALLNPVPPCHKAFRTKRGRRFTSSKVRTRYSPTTPIARRLRLPKNTTSDTMTETPRGSSGLKQARRDFVDEGQRRQDGHREPQVAQSLDGGGAERKNGLLGPPEVLEPAVRRAPEHALGPNVVDAGLFEAHPRPQPPEELVGLGEPQQFVHHPPVDQRKVARIQRHGNVRQAPKDAIEGAARQRQHGRPGALRAPSVDHLVPFSPLLVPAQG